MLECDQSDDPLAVALLGSKRPARLIVECPTQRHRLAAVYDLGEHGGLTFCRPASKESLVHAWGMPGANPNDLHDAQPLRHEFQHSHARLIPVEQLAASDIEADMTLRCRCGTHLLDAPSVARIASRGGVPVITATLRTTRRGRHS
jgi:hypothetical protein